MGCGAYHSMAVAGYPADPLELVITIIFFLNVRFNEKQRKTF